MVAIVKKTETNRPVEAISAPVSSNAVVVISQTNLPAVEPVAKTTNVNVAENSAGKTSAPSREFPNLVLQSIYSQRTPISAMINGRRFNVGDQVQGVTIVEINVENNTVVAEMDGVKKTLSKGVAK